MRSLAIFLCLLILTAGAPAGVQAQENPSGLRRVPALQVGVGFSGLTYQGDLNWKQETYYRMYPGFRLSAQFDNQKRVSPQLGILLGRFSAENRGLGATEGVQPNTYVRTGFMAADVRILIRILRSSRLRPHVGIGLGLLAYDPKDTGGNTLVTNLNTRMESESYGNLAVQFPLVAGFQYRVNDITAIGVEFCHQGTSTDYLDNIGDLGPRPGNDRLQSLTFSLYISPGQKVRQGRR
ncbi:MAG: outer membrane beta-barrel protein [Bacteroidetes bacterium]|nr:outer membrane beta-barrel protein [Bacteroidota bacterium]